MPTEIRTPVVGDLVIFNKTYVYGATVPYIGFVVTVTEVNISEFNGSWVVCTDAPGLEGRTTWGFDLVDFETGSLTLLPAGSPRPPKPPLRGRPNVKPLPLP